MQQMYSGAKQLLIITATTTTSISIICISIINAVLQAGVVLVLGAAPWQRSVICDELARHDPSVPLPADINNEVGAGVAHVCV